MFLFTWVLLSAQSYGLSPPPQRTCRCIVRVSKSNKVLEIKIFYFYAQTKIKSYNLKNNSGNKNTMEFIPTEDLQKFFMEKMETLLEVINNTECIL